MRRITIWITATLAVAGLLFAYQLNASGKSGADGNHTRPDTTAPAEPGDDQHVGKPGENK